MRPEIPGYRDMRSQGSVLVMLLAISAVVAVLGGSMLTLGYRNHNRVTRTTQHMAARVAADAGLTQAFHTLTAQFTDGSLDPLALPAEMDFAIPNSEETFTYAISQDDGAYTIVSTGICQTAQVSVEAVVKSAGLVHEYAVLTRQDLVLRNSAVVDWYNGESGDDPLKIGTNSTEVGKITLYMNSFINGDVLVGAGSDPDDVIRDQGGSYTGDAYAQSTNQPAPPVVVPDYLVSSTSHGDIKNNTTITSSGKYATIDLGQSKKLVIDGHVELYVTGTITLNKSAQIEIKEDASLTLYVDGNVEGKNGSQFNNKTQDPRRFKLMGTESCKDVQLKNSGDMYAIVYAPQADMTVHNSASVRGAVTSKTCELKNGASLYYDASLTDYEDPLLVELKLARWREY